MNKGLKEALKFVVRMLVFAIPLIVTWLTNAGFVEWAGIFSAALAVLDKYIHASPEIKSPGLLPF